MGFKKILDSMVFIDDLYEHRWHDAWGDITKYIPTAGIPSDDTTGEFDAWVDTETGSNTKVNSATANSLFTATTGATEYNGYSSQLKGEAFAANVNTPFYIGGKFSVNDATQSDFLFGLAETDTTLTAASGSHAIAVSGAGFFFAKIDGSTTINFYVYSGGAEVSSLAVGTMDTDLHDYEIYHDGEYVNVYFDGDLIGRTNTSLPTAAMTPSISVRAGSGAARTLECKWLRAIQVYS